MVLIHQPTPGRTAAPAGLSARKVIIVGASGQLGVPTVDALSDLIGADKITVVTRNPGSAFSGKFKLEGVSVVHGDCNSTDSLVRPFTGATAVFLITPGSEVRAHGCA